MKKLTNFVLILIGSVSIVLGIAGIFLPLLPTTPFLLLSAACYIRSSQKLYARLVGNKLLGSYILNYRSGKGIPLKAKIISIAFLWLTMGYSIIFIVGSIYIKTLLLVIAVCVTWHLVSMKTLVVKNTTIKKDSDS